MAARGPDPRIPCLASASAVAADVPRGRGSAEARGVVSGQTQTGGNEKVCTAMPVSEVDLGSSFMAPVPGGENASRSKYESASVPTCRLPAASFLTER
eukprot:774247-Pyramimonas_sp.AAC.1